jgi:fumarate hydratase class I
MALKKTKKSNMKKVVKKSAPKKKVAVKKPTKKVVKKVTKKIVGPENTQKALENSLIELIKITSAVLPDDVQKVILEALHREEKNTTAEYAMNIIKANIDLAKKKSQPLCQDTGTVLFYISHPAGFDQNKFTALIHKAVVKSTELGY